MATLPPLTPDTLDFVLLSFEGPDEYSMAGGLGVRMKELSLELARQGFRTHLVFVGDPHLPGQESPVPNLTLYRWGQWLSAGYEAGVYDGEEPKLIDWNAGVPEFVVSRLVAPAAREGRLVAILAEEWHTAASTCEISDRLWAEGLRDDALILWNANNIMGFDRIDWTRLAYCAQLTTVSRYMKHIMWGRGVNPLVIPNGIPGEQIKEADPTLVSSVRQAFPGQQLIFKIGRFSPDKRWLMAVDALANEKKQGHPAVAIFRGGMEPHGNEVLARARANDLTVLDVQLERDPGEVIQQLRLLPPADIYNVTNFMVEPVISLLYTAADAVLANSGHEPFGLVGLEVMAAGGVAVVGATGEDYAVSYFNSVVLDTDDPVEINVALDVLRYHPGIVRILREDAQKTAHTFSWRNVVEDDLLNRLRYVALNQLVIAPPSESTPSPAGPSETLLAPAQTPTAPHAQVVTPVTAAPSQAAEPASQGEGLPYGGGYVQGHIPVRPRPQEH